MIEIRLNLEFYDGNFQQGFSKVCLEIDAIYSYINAKPLEAQLYPAPEIPLCYQTWKNLYSDLTKSRRAFKDKPTNVPISEHEQELKQEQQERQRKAEEYCQQIKVLRQSLNQWLEPVRSQLDTLLPNLQQPNPEVEVHLIIHTHRIESEADKNILHRLPWQEWSLFPQETTSEVALCLERELSSTQPSLELPSSRKIRRVRVISIFGNTDNVNNEKINTKIDKSLIKDLKKKGAEIETLENPQRGNFIKLWEVPCDILFFAGHSHTEADGQVGKLYINKNDCLNLEEIRRTLKAAIKNGLKIAIFNSCDGLGLAKQLADLNLPYIIVWREEVSDSIAQKFLDYFLRSFTAGKSLFTAVFEARCKLQELTDNSEIQEQLPEVSWLPVICQNTRFIAPTWEDLGGLTGELPDNPYKGLSAFTEKDAAFFFGRETVISDLVAAAITKPLLTIIGASGSGKSSVVFAGLIPRLKQEQENIAIVDLRPGNSPFKNLAFALNKYCYQPQEKQTELEELLCDETRLCDIIESLINSSGYNRLLLVIDQFEELYTLTPENIRYSFLSALLLAVKNASQFTLVLTMRADFYGYALSYRPFSDALQGNVYNLGPMNEEELRNAIEQPAAKMKVELEEGLSSRIINDLGHKPGRLPLLEFALTQLWEKQKNWYLTHAAYQEIGGLNKALVNHADKVLEGKNEVEKFLIEQIFIQLVRPGEGTEDIKRVASEKEIGQERWDLVQDLVSERLIVTDKDKTTQEKTVEIIHEALIREWKTLKEWTKKNNDFRIWQERLKPDVQEWLKATDKVEMLLQGTRLAIAQDWYHKHKDELSSDERNFICESITIRNKQQQWAKRRLFFTISSLASGLVVVSLLATNSEIAKTAAELTQKITEAREFKDYAGLKKVIKAGRQLKFSFWEKWIAPDIKIKVAEALQKKLDSEPTVKNITSKGHSSSVNSVSFSPDGKVIASASGGDNTVKLWDASGKVIQTLNGHSERVLSISFSPNGKVIASASGDKTIKLWCVSNGKLIKTFDKHSGSVNSVSFSPDGKVIASASVDGTVKLWDAASGKLTKTLDDGHSSYFKSVSFSPDNSKVIATAPIDRTVKLWDASSGLPLATLNEHLGSVNSVSFSRDGKFIAFASNDKTVKLWDVATRKVIKTLNGHSDSVNSVSFSRDGKVIASASSDKTVKLWDAASRKLIKTLNGHNRHSESVNSVSFSPDGKIIATASNDKTVKLWDVASRKLKQTLNEQPKPDNSVGDSPDDKVIGSSDSINDASFSPNGKLIASASSDRKVRLWDSALNKQPKILRGHTKEVLSISFSANSKTIATASADKTVKIWDSFKGKEIRPLEGHLNSVNSVSFSPDDKIIATASSDKTIKLWNAETGKKIKTLEGHTDRVNSLSFSSDSKKIASVSNDSTVKLWDVVARKEIKINPTRFESKPISVNFSPNSKIIALGMHDGVVKILSAENGQEIASLPKRDSEVSSVSFSPNGEIFASASADGKVYLWDIASDKENWPLTITLKNKYSNRPVNSVRFSPDSKTIISAQDDGQFVLWHFDLDNLLVRACDNLRTYIDNNLPSQSEQKGSQESRTDEPNIKDKELCKGIGDKPKR